ncbi:adhesion G-protein coupled receptor G5-like isoform X1 [Arapaima gigas]
MVHLHLMGSLLLLNLGFLVNGTLSSQVSEGLCAVLSILLHYPLLTTFTSLALEGIQLLRLLVQVYNVHVRHYFLKASLLIWGAPALIVLIITAVNCKVYGWINTEKSVCWITDNVVRYVMVLGYLGLVMLLNTAVVSRAQRVQQVTCQPYLSNANDVEVKGFQKAAEL